MAELLLELYSEEIPPRLQINARNQIKLSVENSLKEKNIKYKDIEIFSSPTRLTLIKKLKLLLKKSEALSLVHQTLF